MSEPQNPVPPHHPFLLSTPEELHSLGALELAHQTGRLQGLMMDVDSGLWEWHLNSGAQRAQGDIWHLFADSADRALQALWSGTELHPVHSDERHRILSLRHRIASQGGYFDLAFRAYDITGQLRWLRFCGRATTSADGSEVITIGTCADYSEALSQRYLSSLPSERPLQALSGVGDGLWEWDLRADEMVLDDACWGILGYEVSPIRSIGRSAAEQWKARILTEDIARVEQSMLDHVRDRLPLDVEFRLWRSDGSLVWVRCRGKAQLDSRGQPVRVLGILQDVSASRETQARLERELHQQREENAHRADLLFSLSHELRTPLNAILGYSQMVELDQSLNSDQRQRLGEIRRAGQHLLHLVGDVLELARIDSRRLGPSMESVRPVELVAECKRLLEPLAETRRVSLVYEPLGWESAYICADPVRYKQVVLNLAGNAVKYNRDNGRVIINFTPQAEGWLRLSILDTGKGIPPERRSEVFEPFNRLGEEKGHIEGTGVGLAIARRLTEAMGGRIDFDSQEGQGSVFWIEFPMIDAPDALMSFSAHPQEPPKLPEGRLLLVDNRPAAADQLREMLKETPQIQCLVATDVVEAIFIARTQRPDVLLFHSEVPGMSAADLLSILQEDIATRAMRFVLVGEKPNGESYLVLPSEFDFMQLSRVLAETLGRSGRSV
ncbi:ATP-binding protein [Microbulbifer sp. THAF38]|uniref:hybrid sensor histidine kinase/response regulator n=1 Tax=Microbulbifer sp. THAF38 TaxID=2587856 RepID=UPI00126931AE|nr:ATP-binding protein [Microbulbifer sp. THAF38]QFT53856.1 Autoinducer 2 sensor kinase/phosphatase LuxQ [Microbulbifer sp. THAF38]